MKSPSVVQRIFSAILVFFLIASTEVHSADPSLKLSELDQLEPNTRIGFLGDSITQGVSLGRLKRGGGMSTWTDDMDPSLGSDQGGLYHQFIQVFLATRYPGKGLWTVNFGESGGSARGAIERLATDFLPDRTDVVVVHFGMNDVQRNDFTNLAERPDESKREKTRETYRSNLTELVETVQQAGCQVVILSPTNYDDSAEGKSTPAGGFLNAELGRFTAIAKSVAEENGAAFVDVHAPLTEITLAKQKENPNFSFTSDRIHPRNGGDSVMVTTILRELGASPSVYQIALDADGKPLKEENAKVLETDASNGGLRFRLEENALPFPVIRGDKGFDWAGFNEQLNQQKLTIAGLAPGKYRLMIDDKEVGSYGAEEFAKGIDLATNEKTPQFQEALAIRNLILGRKILLEQRLRVIRLNLRGRLKTDDPKNFAAIDWNDTASIQASLERVVAKGRPTGWARYVLDTAEIYLPKYEEMVAELVDIKKKLAAIPSTNQRSYQLLKL